MSQQNDQTSDDSQDPADAPNPYATPVAADSPASLKPLPHDWKPPVPWEPGWLVIVPMAIVCGFAVALFGMEMGSPLFSIVVLPILSMAALAIVVRILHSKTPVVLPLYILLSILSGFASYILLIPVCIAVVIPGTFLIDLFRIQHQQFLDIGFFAIPITISFLLFSLFLRLYLRSKHRTEAYRQRLLARWNLKL